MTASKGKPQAKELVNKFLEKRYSADIEKKFHLWLLDENNREEKDLALADIWEATGHGSPKEALGSLKQVREKLGFPTTTANPFRKRLALRIAAVIIPFMVIAGGYILWNSRPEAIDTTPVAYLEAQAGSNVILPDNTVVEVKEGVLFYPDNFRGYERRVRIEGNAYFDVTSDAEHPFVVEGHLLSVRVTGTEFMISTDDDFTVSTVSLVEGSVDVLIEGFDPIALREGYELTYDSVTGDITIAEMFPALGSKEALTEGKMVFSNATLTEILNTVASVRGVEISLPSDLGGATVYEVKFSRNEPLEEILEVLKLLSDGFNYQLSDKEIIIE